MRPVPWWITATVAGGAAVTFAFAFLEAAHAGQEHLTTTAFRPYIMNTYQPHGAESTATVDYTLAFAETTVATASGSNSRVLAYPAVAFGSTLPPYGIATEVTEP